jgi:hypothetical protein
VLLAPEEALAMEVHGGKEAAVLVPLFEDRGLHAVFTRRRHDLRRVAAPARPAPPRRRDLVPGRAPR